MNDRPAGFWIGHPGALLPLPGIKGDLVRKVSRAASYTVSASGQRRAYLAARRAPLREWNVTIPWLQPDEAATLHGLLMATDPPYVWVDPWGRVTNLLTPAASDLASTLPALARSGRQPLEGDRWAPTAALNPTAQQITIEPAPVVAAMPVTISAYLASPTAARVTAVWLNSNGAQIGITAASPNVSGVDFLRRAAVVNAMPPLDAAAVSIRVNGATLIAQPAVTWTAELLEYGPGGGATRVLITELDETPRWAPLSAGKERIVDVSFTVTEVG